MKKIIILLFFLLIVGCQISTNKIKSITFDEYKQMINSKETFIVYVGRSDCQDCKLFDEYIEKLIIPENIKFVKMDIKKYRDQSKKKNTSANESDIYTNIKKTFNLSWVPTIYKIKGGNIISKFQYLDSEYHSLNEEDKTQRKKYYENNFKIFLKGG